MKSFFKRINAIEEVILKLALLDNIKAGLYLIKHDLYIDELFPKNNILYNYALVNKNLKINELKNSKYPAIRAQIAKKGYFLDEYINDESEFVREIAKNKINENITKNN